MELTMQHSIPLSSITTAAQQQDYDTAQRDTLRERFAAEASIEWHRLNGLACDAQREATHWGWIAREFIQQRDAQLKLLDKENNLNLPYTDEQRSVIRKAREAVKDAIQPFIGAAVQGQRKKAAEANRYSELKTAREV
jgi:hypothetical protein